MCDKISLTFKYVLKDEIALCHDDEKGDVSPSEEAELLHVVLLDEAQHEPYKADAVQREGQEAMVLHQHSEIFLGTQHFN